MKKQLNQLWKSRTPSDRKLIAALSIILVIILYTGFVLSAERLGTSLNSSVIALRAQAAHLDEEALEYSHLRRTPMATSSPTDLHTLVQARVENAGLSTALVHMDAIDNNQVITVFGAIAFSDWLNWIIAMKSQHIRVASCRIEAMSTPGLVSVTATLVRTQ